MSPPERKDVPVVPDLTDAEVRSDNKAVDEGQSLANDQDLGRSDSREIGRLSGVVGRLVTDVSSLSTKVETLQSQVTYVKGWIAAAIVIIPIAFGAVAWLMTIFLNGKWDAVITAIHAAQK